MSPTPRSRPGFFRRLWRHFVGPGRRTTSPAPEHRWRRGTGQWLDWSPKGKRYGIAGVLLLALLAMFAFLVWTGIASAMEAREQFEALEVEAAHLSPVDLLQVDVYQSLSTRFREAERSAGRARSRLSFARLLTWLPLAGGRIREAQAQLDMAFFLARAGHNLATTYQAALELPLDKMDDDEAAKRIGASLEKAVPRLLQVEGDLQRVRELRVRLNDTSFGGRYGPLIDRFLPQIQTITYISRTSPKVIGQSYVLYRELSAIDKFSSDPLQVLSNPSALDRSLSAILDGSQRLAAELEIVHRAARENTSETAETREEVLRVTGLMEQGVTLLEHATTGSRGLLTTTKAAEEYGFLSKDFGRATRQALDEAEVQLALARDESVALRSLLTGEGSSGDALFSGLAPGKNNAISLSSVDRLEVLLERALDTTRFMRSFLGFQGPRTYLLLGQNQQEIRATGGFIGLAVQITLDQGELVNLVYHESHFVDRLPPEYPNNPPPPEPLYWYLWMGRLLFRDANWSPNFPSSAAQIADLYRLGQGVQVDGVITGSKSLMIDMVGLLGDVRVPGLSQPLTRETAAAYTDEKLPYPCGPKNVSAGGKRCFDEDVFFALRARLSAHISGEERVAIARLLKSSLDRGNILVHVFDPEEGKLLWELGWNGAIRAVDHDYLLVVDSSLPGHTAEGVQRSWEYQVSLDQGQPVKARLRVRYDHQGMHQNRVCRQSEPKLYDCYWNYFRVYLPRTATSITRLSVPLHEGSEKLIWGYPEADSASLVHNADVGPAKLTEIGGFIAVEPGSVTTIPLEYELPWEILRPSGQGAFEYRLLVQKQPGMDRDQVSVAVELPAGAELRSASPSPTARNGRWVSFNFPLTSDREVVVSFAQK